MGAITSGAVVEAVVAAWDAAGIDALFLAQRQAGPNQNDQVLHDTQAKPGTPFPYCVFTQERIGGVQIRMTADGGATNEVRVTRFAFTVHGASKPACNQLAEAIALAMQQVGAGCVFQPLFVDDMGWQEGEEEWAWIVLYDFKYLASVLPNPACGS